MDGSFRLAWLRHFIVLRDGAGVDYVRLQPFTESMIGAHSFSRSPSPNLVTGQLYSNPSGGRGPKTYPFAAEPDSRAAVAFVGGVFMADIKIEVWDATGNKRQIVEVPADAEVNRLIAVLIERMNLPRNSPDGQMMSYKFHHKSSGRQLLDTETLAAANVKDGDILRLQPEITAGGS